MEQEWGRKRAIAIASGGTPPGFVEEGRMIFPLFSGVRPHFSRFPATMMKI
jgi:hypothetical protein